MEQIKIIFFDVDGTLVDMKKKKISANTVETLQRLRQKGIRICMATGRTPVTGPSFEGVEFDAYLTFNGSYC
jgi:HAD superfamily hydrolase (TIGR01484 family)